MNISSSFSSKVIQTERPLVLKLPNIETHLRNMFLSPSQSDVMFKKEDKMIPTHSFVIRKFCGRLLNDIFGDLPCEYGVIELPDNIDIQTFKQVLGCLYGFDLKFNRRNILIFLRTITYLCVKLLITAIEKDMLENFREHELFLMLDAAVSLRFPDVEKACRNELENQNFQQIRTSRHYLNKCSEKVFICVLKYHNEAKLDGLPVQEDQIINDVIAGYASAWCYSESQKIALLSIVANSKREKTRVSSKPERRPNQEIKRVKRGETQQIIIEQRKQLRDLFRSPNTEPNNADKRFKKIQEQIKKIKMENLQISRSYKEIDDVVASLNKNADREQLISKKSLKHYASLKQDAESVIKQFQINQSKFKDLQTRVDVLDKLKQVSISLKSASQSSSQICASSGEATNSSRIKRERANAVVEEQELANSLSEEQKRIKYNRAQLSFKAQNIQSVKSDFYYELSEAKAVKTKK